MRTEKIKRKLILNKDGEVVIKLDATDVCNKEDFIQLYDGRVQEKTQLQDRIRQYKEQLEKIKNFESESELKEIVKKMEKSEDFSQKLFAILQKKMVSEQVRIWEKALENMNKELSDLSSMYKKLREEKDGKP